MVELLFFKEERTVSLVYLTWSSYKVFLIDEKLTASGNSLLFRQRVLSICSRCWRFWLRTSSTFPSPSLSTRRPPCPKLRRRSGFESPTCWATLWARWTWWWSPQWGKATVPSSWPTARWPMPETGFMRLTCSPLSLVRILSHTLILFLVGWRASDVSKTWILG